MRRILCALAVFVAIGCNVLSGASDFTVGADALPDASDAAAPDVKSAGTEDCTNGIDDDGDGLTDCADPKCQSIGYACSLLEEGWLGPFATTSGPSTLPPCAAPFATVGVEAKEGLHAAPAVCNCSCGSPSGGNCYAAFYGGTADCTATSATVTLMCKPITTSTMGRVTAVSGSGGTCKLNDAIQEDVTWDRTIRACGSSVPLPVGGCVGAARCAPPVPQGFAPGHCIAHDGDKAICPLEYPNKRVVFRGYDDDRRCAGCACVPPTCPTGAYAYSSVNCADGTGVAFDDVCRPAGKSVYSVRVGNGRPLECELSPGTPQGTASATGALTICCAG